MDQYNAYDEMRDQLKWLPMFWFTKARSTTVHYYEVQDAKGNPVDLKNFIYAPKYTPRPVGLLTPGVDQTVNRLTPREIGLLTPPDLPKAPTPVREKLFYWEALQLCKYYFVYPHSAVLQQLLDVTAGVCRDVHNLLNERVLAYTFKNFTNDFNRWCK